MGREWKYTLNLKDIWEKAVNDEIKGEVLIEKITSQLETIGKKALFNSDEYEKDELADLIQCLKNLVDENGDIDTDEFDYLWDEVYDWCDIYRVWVNT